MTSGAAPIPPDPVPGLSGRAPVGERRVGDLFGPFFRVQFISATKEGGEEALSGSEFTEQKSLVPATSTRADDQGLSEVFELDSRLLPKIAASLKIESNAGSPLKFTLTLTPPYEDGIRILNNRLITFGTIVRVQWGYTSWGADNNILSDVYVFRNNVPQADFGNDISITLSGHDLAADVGMKNQHRKQWAFSTYPCDLAIVEAIVSGTNIKVNVDDVPPDSNFLTGKNRKPDQQAVLQVTNDWAFIKHLCNAHSLSCDARGDQLRIYSLYDFSGTTQKASYRFLWRVPPTTSRDIPVYNVKGNLQPYLFLPPTGRGLVDFTFNPDNMSSTAKVKDGTTVDGTPVGPGKETGTTEPSTQGIPGTLASAIGDSGETVISEDGVSYTPRPEQGDDEIGSFVSMPMGAHNYEEKADQLVRKAQAFSHPIVGVTSPGVVDVWPGVLCELYGTSRLFDGPYTVLKATHSIGNGGYDMDLQLMRHTIITEDSPPGGKPIAPKVEETADGSDVDPNFGGTLADSPPDDTAIPFPGE